VRASADLRRSRRPFDNLRFGCGTILYYSCNYCLPVFAFLKAVELYLIRKGTVKVWILGLDFRCWILGLDFRFGFFMVWIFYGLDFLWIFYLNF